MRKKWKNERISEKRDEDRLLSKGREEKEQI